MTVISTAVIGVKIKKNIPHIIRHTPTLDRKRLENETFLHELFTETFFTNINAKDLSTKDSNSESQTVLNVPRRDKNGRFQIMSLISTDISSQFKTAW